MAHTDTQDGIGSGEQFLDGQMLIAMPGMADPRFSRSVIYLCAHSDDGAMGIIINQHAPNINFCELLDQLNITSEDDAIHMPPTLQAVDVHVGGPVETGRGFVLHSADYYLEESTLPINDGVNLTATLDILRAIATGDGPNKALLALGYAGWAPGQLENEFQSNGWLHCPANQDVLFESNIDKKYQLALETIGIDPARLVNDSGHA
jgi:putative transcriptional regulator